MRFIGLGSREPTENRGRYVSITNYNSNGGVSRCPEGGPGALDMLQPVKL
jgi:hypothetical protein